MRALLDEGLPPVPRHLDAMTKERWSMGFWGTFRAAAGRQLLLLRMDAALVRDRVVQVRRAGWLVPAACARGSPFHPPAPMPPPFNNSSTPLHTSPRPDLRHLCPLGVALLQNAAHPRGRALLHGRCIPRSPVPGACACVCVCVAPMGGSGLGRALFTKHALLGLWGRAARGWAGAAAPVAVITAHPPHASTLPPPGHVQRAQPRVRSE